MSASLRSVSFLLPEGLKLTEPLVRELVFRFDESYIHIDGSGESGWWEGRTLHGIPSTHLTRDEKGIHVRGTDMNDAWSHEWLDIRPDYRAIEADTETALGIVAPLLGEWQVPYTVDLGTDGLIYKEEARDLTERTARIGGIHSPLPGTMPEHAKECEPSEHDYRYVTCNGWSEKKGLAVSVSSNGAFCIRCGQFREDIYYDSRKNKWIKPF